MLARADRPEIRNPVLALPAAAKLAELEPEARALVRQLMRELSADARQRAEQSWRRHKAPMAAYWKAVAVYARHIGAALNQVQRP